MGTWRSKNCSPVTCDVVLDAGTMVRWRVETGSGNASIDCLSPVDNLMNDKKLKR